MNEHLIFRKEYQNTKFSKSKTSKMFWNSSYLRFLLPKFWKKTGFTKRLYHSKILQSQFEKVIATVVYVLHPFFRPVSSPTVFVCHAPSSQNQLLSIRRPTLFIYNTLKQKLILFHDHHSNIQWKLTSPKLNIIIAIWNLIKILRLKHSLSLYVPSKLLPKSTIVDIINSLHNILSP